LEWDAELLNILSTKQKPELLSSQPVQIDEVIIQRSPNATDASLQTSFIFYPVCECHQPMKLHITPGAILYYLPIWWIVMYGSLSSGKSSLLHHKSSCASRLAAHAQCLKSHKKNCIFQLVALAKVSTNTSQAALPNW
jgi:hypothetical protein